MDTQKSLFWLSGAVLTVCISVVAFSATDGKGTAVLPKASSLPLDSLDGLEIKAVSETGGEPVKAKADVVTYRGRRALHMLNDDSTMGPSGPSGGESLAIVKDSDFRDGTLEVDLVAMPRQGSNSQSRGFIGIAFRIQGDVERFENFYLRFTNARSDDQVRRNHSTQYSAFPEFP